MKLRHVLAASGNAPVVLIIDEGNAARPISVFQLVAIATHQDHYGIQLLAVVVISDKPNQVILQAGHVRNLVLQLFPDIVELYVCGVEVLGLGDLEKGIQGNGAPADLHVGGQAVYGSALEKVYFIQVSFQNLPDGVENCCEAFFGEIAGTVAAQNARHRRNAFILGG
jgi:hypothetical protein